MKNILFILGFFFFLGVKEGVNLVYLYWFTQYIYIISFLFGGGDGYSNISVSIYS